METPTQRDELEELARRLEPLVDHLTIEVRGAACMLVAERGDRGFELYRGVTDEIIVEPSLGTRIKGELSFPTYDEALAAALRWLDAHDVIEA